jgi:hypothetical protein
MPLLVLLLLAPPVPLALLLLEPPVPPVLELVVGAGP